MFDAPPLPADWAEVRVIDGDTFAADGVKYRLSNIDAPEMNGKCLAERLLAKKAAGYLEAALASKDLKMEVGKNDKYGRVLAWLSIDGNDVGYQMIEDGYAVIWEGKRATWCKD